MIRKILIANRGEIALRVIRACRELKIKTVAIYSTADYNSMHVKMADETICIGPPNPTESYLNIARIISAAEVSGSDAIHPGYGFLSENSDFAESVESSGFIFIGPHPDSIRMMGDKISAIQNMRKLGIPCLPSYISPIGNDEKCLKMAEDIGYPIIIKAASGGGGRGMRVIKRQEELIDALQLTALEAKTIFKSDKLYMEKFLRNPRHIEVQIFGDGRGNAIHFYDRDCSIQRRHQKIIEEAPSTFINNKTRTEISKKCVEVCRKINYRGAGTFEFLYENGKFYFIEMNTRIQVEHPITEAITNTDLVKEQINIASGKGLTYQAKDININGHAIECRINAEDPDKMLPSPGKINLYHAPGGPGVRVDSHIYSQYFVPYNYDSMIAKLIVYGRSREAAIQRMKSALEEIVISGIKTNIPLHKFIINQEEFQKGSMSVNYFKEINEN